MQMDDMTQQNAALVEAGRGGGSEAMDEQARGMKNGLMDVLHRGRAGGCGGGP